MERPRTRYARRTLADGTAASIAWQQFGAGAHDIVMVYGLVSHVDAYWDVPAAAAFLEGIGRYARVTHFDKRGVGMSDRVLEPPSMDDRLADMLAVLDEAGVERATIWGTSEGAPVAVLFADRHPERVERLVLVGGMARTTEAPDYPFAAPKEALVEAALAWVQPHWEDSPLAEVFEPSVADDPVARDRFTRLQQLSASPAMAVQLYVMALDIDVRDLLPRVAVPVLVVHRRGDRVVPVQAGRWLAEQIPGARYLELEGNDHVSYIGDFQVLVDEVERFITGTVAAPPAQRALMTVMFTDIAGSTVRAEALGDAVWRGLLERHDEVTRDTVARHGGVLRKTLGDGAMATFDLPGRAAEAALELHGRMVPLGLALRVGLHFGEVEVRGEDIAGIAVHVAARVQAEAEPGEVLATSTVRDLAAGAALAFADRGERDLKGIDRPWQLFAVEARA